MKNLPKGWKNVELHEVVSVLGDGLHGTPKYTTESDYYFINGNNLVNGKITIKENTKKVSFEEFVKYKKVLNNNTVLVSINGTLGNIAFYNNEKVILGKSACYFNVLECLNKNYIRLILSGNQFLNYAHKSATGSTIPNVSLKTMREFRFPLPPLETQQRIVAKIEELFSELDKGVEELKKTQEQLKTYRQSVLKWAFEGRFTNENVKDGELPEGWEIVTLKEVCEVKRGKSKHRPRNAVELYGGNYPFIQTGDIRNSNGGYIKNYSQTYSEIGLAQSKIWPKGTLCITIAANIGETAILDFDACFPDSVVGLLSNNEILFNKFLNYFFISFKQKLEELAPATAQKNINVDILEKVKISLPQISEQHQIVKEIESRLSVADKLEEQIKTSLQQAEALRQSILKKAFEGELVR